MKTVLITGASGALGQAVVARLEQENQGRGGKYPGSAPLWHIITAGRHNAGTDGVYLDVRNREQVFAAVENTRPDLVLHLAATLAENFDEAYSVNVDAARHLCDAASNSGRATRIVVIGSAAEYGVVQPHENPVGTAQALRPVSLYGMTKAWQSLLAGRYAFAGVDVVVARIFNLDGPNMPGQLFIGRIQRQIAALLAKQQTHLQVGPLDAIRDYVSTTEAAVQLLAIARLGMTGCVYHVGSGKPTSMRNVLRRYLDSAGLDFSLVQEDVGLSNRKGYDVPAIVADMANTTVLCAKDNGI